MSRRSQLHILEIIFNLYSVDGAASAVVLWVNSYCSWAGAAVVSCTAYSAAPTPCLGFGGEFLCIIGGIDSRLTSNNPDLCYPSVNTTLQPCKMIIHKLAD